MYVYVCMNVYVCVHICLYIYVYVTWHEDADDVSLRRLRSAGLQLLERARPVRPGSKIDDVYYQNYGGMAVVASAAVRLTKLNAPFEPVTFEHLIARVTVAGSSFVFAVVYRPVSATVTAAFFDEFRVLLEHLSSFATPMSSLAILTYASTVRAIRRRYVPLSCWTRLVQYR